MPSGRTHDRITLTCLPVLAGTTLVLTQAAPLTGSLCAGFWFSGWMFGPDLDIYSIQFKRWGPLKILWLPYQKGLRHRSWLSHGPIVGTLLRLVYLSFWVVLGCGLVGMLIYSFGGLGEPSRAWLMTVSRIWEQYKLEIVAGLGGLELGAMSHYGSDWLSSCWKSMFKAHHFKRKDSRHKVKRRP